MTPKESRQALAALLGLIVIGGLLAWGYHHHGRGTPAARPLAGPLELLQISSGTIGAGGSLSHSLELAGLDSSLISRLEKTLRPLFDPRHAKASDRYEIFRSTGHDFIRMHYWPDAFEYYQVTQGSSATLMATHQEIPLTESTVGVSGQIHSSLWESMIAQGVPPEMIYRFAEMFGWRIDFLTEPREGDTFKMIWKRRHSGTVVRDGAIVAAYYDSREKGDVYGFPLAGDYFDADGNSLRGEFLRAPLAYRRISSRFTEHRFHPILRIYRPHHGIDYSAARGTPAVCVGDGVVIERGWGGGLGNEIRLRHAQGYVSIYGHLMGFARGTQVGSRLRQGQVVGYVGSTGLSTGPHLHFGFEHDGQLIDFLSLKLQGNLKTVPTSEHANFAQVKQDATILFSKLTSPGTALQTLTP